MTSDSSNNLTTDDLDELLELIKADRESLEAYLDELEADAETIALESQAAEEEAGRALDQATDQYLGA